ncbi:MAG: transglutaminase-like domain-containing protein [Candidatus Rokuibacteriota bacterium]
MSDRSGLSTPPLLLGAALVFWGWQTALLPLAVAVAVVLEGARLVGWRWDLSRKDVDRIADLGRVVLVGMAVYLAATRGVARSVLVLVQWFPLAVVPLVACQAYGRPDRIDLRTFALILRRARADGHEDGAGPVSLAYPSLGLVILAASAANVRTPGFYVGLCVLAAWALWGVRSRRFSPAVWAGLLAVSAGVGYGGHVGLHQLQALIESTMLEWYFELLGRETDAYRGVTAIGRIGRLKLSNRILLRVDLGDREPPLLLHEASFNVYGASVWGAVDAGFELVRPEPDLRTWQLQPGIPAARTLTVSAYLRQGRGLLPMPPGAARIEGLVAVGLKRNRLGAVRVEEGPGLATYRVAASAEAPLEGPPDRRDLLTAAADAAVVSRIAGELRLAGLPPGDAVGRVAAYFRDHFRYSLYRVPRHRSTPALEEFLLDSRAGHCEYFATATALLLRAAGIPARYATGYAVTEWSRREGVFVVRQRHAHSWVRAWVDGAWLDVDTTPAVWADAEREAASAWEPLYDLWAWGVFAFERWRWAERDGQAASYLGWLLVPLLVILAWRVYAKKRVSRDPPPVAAGPAARPRPGDDSEFYAIERRLGALGLGRHPWEPVPGWVRRVEEVRLEAVPTADLRRLAALHCRYRFDPDGVDAAAREALRSGVRTWLAGAERVQSGP